MATKTSGWLCTHTVSTANNSDPTKLNVTVTCYWKNNGWAYDINYVSAWVYCGSQSYQVKNSGSIDSTGDNYKSVSCGSYTFVVNKSTSAQSLSCYAKITSSSSYVSGTKSSTATSVSIPAKTSYKVTYNANGGSGAPSAQTKYQGTNLTLSSVIPTRSGYSFQGWGTSSSTTTVSYKAGATYTANAAITLYAVWKAGAYTVAFNANGGSLGSVPSTMSKTHGVALTLPTAKPTRTNYNFKGWGKSASATTVAYQPGGSYTANAAITLYAIWEVGYTKPRITGVSIKRVNSTGVVDDSGTRINVKFTWATDKTITKIRIDGKKQTDTSWFGHEFSASGTSGSFDQTIDTVNGNAFDSEQTYQIRITVSDSSGSNTVTQTLSSMRLPIDVKHPSGSEIPGVAIGKTAEQTALFDVAPISKFRNTVLIGEKTDYKDGKTGVYINHSGYIHLQRSTTDGKPYLAFLADQAANENVAALVQYNASKDHLEFLDAGGYRYDNSLFSQKPLYIGSKTAYNDANTGWYLGSDGTAHVAKSSGGGAIYFHYSGDSNYTSRIVETASGTLTIGNNATVSSNLTVSNNATVSSNLTVSKELTVGTKATIPSIVSSNTYSLKLGVNDTAELIWLYRAGGVSTGNKWLSPVTNSGALLGASSYRWKEIWSTNALNTASDRKVKRDILSLDERYENLFAKLQPCSFKFIDGNSGRAHTGFISQDIEKSLSEVGLTPFDFAAFCKDIETKEVVDPETGDTTLVNVCDDNGDPVYTYSLRYEEFIALNTHMIQKLQAENRELNDKVSSLEERLFRLESMLDLNQETR